MSDAAIESLRRTLKHAEASAERNRSDVQHYTSCIAEACAQLAQAETTAASCRAAITKLEAAS